MRNLYDEGAISFCKDKTRLTKQLRNCFILLTAFTFTRVATAQIVVTQNANAQDLAQSLAGSGVTVSNFSVSGNSNSSGTFVNTSSNLGINAGVVLSTGNVANIAQPASGFASNSYSGNGDAQLQSLTGGYVYDKSVLEFDIVPQGNVLLFNYVFASEEYPEWVCTQFNDVFGFFISGPNPAGGNYSNRNIAKVPNSNLPVAINTINPGVSGAYGVPTNCQSLAYSSLFRNNLTPTVNQQLVYDGMTAVLTAVASVTPCQTYHLKLAVADVNDRIYDSGVFIEANSITSIPITITSSAQLDSAGYQSAYEGCVSGTFTFSMPTAQPNDVQVGIHISGTATNGVDYPTIPSVITIPAGYLSKSITVLPVQDNAAEPDETIIISTSNPCTGQVISSAQMTIKDDVPAAVTATPNIICAGQSTQLEATGGLHYVWSPALHLTDASIYNPVASPDSTTTYTVSMEWGSCVKTATQTITVGGTPLQLAATPSLTSCDGGPVQLQAIGGNSFTWSNGGHTSMVAVTATGNYTVTATDATGCNTTASAHVVISNLSITNPQVTPSCGGAANGSVDIEVNGSGAPFTYLWSTNETAQDLSNVHAGSYDVTVSNADGCSATQTFTIPTSVSGISLSASVTDVTCNGGNTGSINLSVNGGNAPYHFAWSNGASTSGLTNLNAGSFEVTVTDALGCGQTDTFTVAQINGISASASKTNVHCYGANDGSINISLNGGTAPYQYIWNDGLQTANRNNLSAGSYSLTITDANGCFAVNTTQITQPAPLQIQLNTSASSCSAANGSANAIATDGTAPYVYYWSVDSTWHNSAISNLAPGNIHVTVTDGNNCSAAQTAAIVVNNNMDADYTYSGNFCESAATIHFTASSTANTFVHGWNFGGNNYSAAVNPNYTFAAAGTYTITHVVSSGYCSDTVVKVLTINPNPAITATVHPVSCNQTHNGSIQLNVTNGTSPYTYNWGGGIHSPNRTNLYAGNYHVTVTDANHCAATYQATITTTAGIALSESHINPTCFGTATGSIDLTTNGGSSPLTYHWNNGATVEDISALTGGSYTVSVQDANNCSATKTVILTEPSEIVITNTKADATCHGMNNGSVDITVSGGISPYTYHWSNGANTPDISSLPAGYYTLTVTDGSVCSAISHITIDEPVELSVQTLANDPLCYGANTGSIDLDVNGGDAPYTFMWSTGATSAQLSDLAGGHYEVTITDQAGCVTQANVTLAQPTAISATETHTNVGCMNSSSASIQLTVSGGQPSYLYQWNNGAQTAEVINLNSGNYSVTITDANGCTAEMTNIHIGQAPSLTLTTSVTDAACTGVNNGAVQLHVNGGNAPYQFNWSNGSTIQNQTGLAPGDYTVSVIDALGCSQSVSAYISTISHLQVTANVMSPNCLMPEGAIDIEVLNGTAPYTYEWSTGAMAAQLTNLEPGSYSLHINDANQCPFDTSFIIAESQPFTVTATGNTSVTMGESAALHVTSSGSAMVSYNWLQSSEVSCSTCADVTVVPARSTVYTVVATDTNGCVAQDTVSVEVLADNTIFLPNAFTPNGDGTNDLLQLYGNLAGIRYFQLLVFDRWGEKVFETNDQYFKWDGTYRGEKLEPAAYIYIMKIVRLDGTTDRTFKGALTLLK